MYCRWWDLQSLCNLTLRNSVSKFLLPRVNFLRPVAGIKFEAHLVDKSVQFLCLNICYVLCSIVNKILPRVIWKSFSFQFISNFQTPNISGIRYAQTFQLGKYQEKSILSSDVQ